MSGGIPPPPSERLLGPEYTIPIEKPISNHRESRSRPEISSDSEMMVSPPRSTASKQSVFQNNLAIQAELEQIEEGRIHGLHISNFRRSGAEDDFDSKNIDIRGLLDSLRHMRAKSQTQYRTLRTRKRKGEIDSDPPAPTTAESKSSEESKTTVLGSSRIAKAPARRRIYQEPRGPSKRKGGRESRYDEDSSAS
ncbi:hypothetical protein C7212DRAFT_357377 [Tuber magnatum]|uniref:Uncharacterized protein n=1 Tax=Tuber magnatum TaxID=42249 RepID=A0A317SPU6_9PEZI|nr:hypothetical protein C7212DRAFT_357377 [Tuber magnatum]